MRKVTLDDIQRSAIHAEGIAKRRTRKKSNKSSSKGPLRIFSRVCIFAPAHLDLFNPKNYADFVILLTRIRDEVERKERVIINFKNTESLKACAMVVLYAHIDFLQRLTGDENIIKITLCGNKRANRWFKDSGIWNLTRFNSTGDGEETSLHIISALAGSSKNKNDDVEARNKIRLILKFIKEKIYGGKISPEEAQKLYAAVTESISNVGLHAYSSESQFEEFIELIGKRWWVLARQIEDQLFLVIYDMGEGIPSTLVKRDFFTFLYQIFQPETDADKIFAAVQYGETRMKSDKHGKGLHDIKTFVVDNPMGELHIFSGMGKYSFKSATGEESKTNLEYSVGGTLIQWNISLKAKS
ncbi:TPA: hypothetical protein I9742_001544 [Serratia marcescens]|nr:hypothetical protein [Serratia marcescens]